MVVVLQCLMTRMAMGQNHKPASATQLIASFGWDSDDTLMQVGHVRDAWGDREARLC